jgi:hypothetical protein
LASGLCALTDEMLPLYAEGVLDSGTRRRIDDHAAECPACQERLNRAVASLAPPPGAGESRDEYARLMSARIRRILVSVVIGMLVLLTGVGGLRYAAARKQPWELDGIPARVTSAEQVAARAIPGWNRAKAAGLVVDIGLTEKIPGTAAAITLEKAWYSGRQAYILYTVKAPKGGYGGWISSTTRAAGSASCCPGGPPISRNRRPMFISTSSAAGAGPSTMIQRVMLSGRVSTPCGGTSYPGTSASPTGS